MTYLFQLQYILLFILLLEVVLPILISLQQQQVKAFTYEHTYQNIQVSAAESLVCKNSIFDDQPVRTNHMNSNQVIFSVSVTSF